MSADYGRDTGIPSMKHNQSFEADARDMSYANVNNSMISKAYQDVNPYGKFRYFHHFKF